MGRRRSSKYVWKGLGVLFLISILIKFMILLVSSPIGKAFLLLIIGFTVWYLIRKHKERNEKIEKIEGGIQQTEVSDNRFDYIIENNDYRRGIPKENQYRKLFFLTLAELHGNACAKCKRTDNGVDIDHFVFSKNEGGCFIMRHKDGYFINNAVLLCQTCNRSKSDKSYKNFYSREELLILFQKNKIMTHKLNKTNVLDTFKITAL